MEAQKPKAESGLESWDQMASWRSSPGPAAGTLGCHCLHFLCRTYDHFEQWKAVADREVIRTGGLRNRKPNGTREMARPLTVRRRLAALIARYYVVERPKDETVERWNRGHKAVVPFFEPAPVVSVRDAATVDWVFIADYLLLHTGTVGYDPFASASRLVPGQLKASHTEPFLLRNDQPPHRPARFENNDCRQQRKMLNGLDALPGQLDLF